MKRFFLALCAITLLPLPAAARFSYAATEHVRTCNIAAAVELFRLDVHRYPTMEEGLRALVRRPPYARYLWRGPYLRSAAALYDPAGRPFYYRAHNNRFWIFSAAGAPMKC